jgi:hypothetical protein
MKRVVPAPGYTIMLQARDISVGERKRRFHTASTTAGIKS